MKSPNIEKQLDELSSGEQFKMKRSEGLEQGRCITCGEPFSEENVFTEAGWRETKSSCMCEKCFDELFAE